MTSCADTVPVGDSRLAAADTAPAASSKTLRISGLHAWYGNAHVLQGVSMSVEPGTIVTLLGRNGSGRSTLLKSVMGMTTCKGSVVYGGEELIGRPPFGVARLGLGYVPESREVFSRLTVEQNLQLGAKPRIAASVAAAAVPAWTQGDMYRMFPLLGTRRKVKAGSLSGGEQQMLTLCRTLMGNPSLMLIDEPTEGLAPAMVQQVATFLLQLREHGVSVLLVEQKAGIAMMVSDRCSVMGRGRIVFEGTPAELAAADEVRREWLEV